ncbi:MAG: TonB-dependent receptor [Desulfobacterales bacterium]|nr:TonB-dependent receptor [Desulfobacterales bacterium]
MRIRNVFDFWVCLLGVVLFFFVNITAAEEETAAAGSKVYELGEIIVTEEQQTVNLATTITEVSLEDIQQKGAQTVAEALELLPAVDVQKGGKGQAYVSVRGFDQRDIKVLIDGVPAQETYFGTVDLSMIPIGAISKITVTKGASSVLYGANTMGGVVNIITKKGLDKPFTEITSSIGDYNTRNVILNHGSQIDKFNYWLTYEYRESDGYRLSDDFNKNGSKTGMGTEYNEDGGRRDLSDYIKRTLHAKVGYDPDPNTSLYLSFDYHNNERGVPTEYSRYWAFKRWDQWHLNLVGEKKINDILILKARGFYVEHKDTLKDVGWEPDHITDRKWFETSSYDDYSVGGMANAFLDLGKWSYLKFGANYTKDNHKEQDFLDDSCWNVIKGWDAPGYLPEMEYEANTYTIAVEDEIKPIEPLSFIFGLSYDYFEPKKAYDQPVPDDIDTFNPQVGVVFDWTAQTKLHASVGKKTRFPKLIELYSDHAGGNPDLDPQEAVSYELGISHDFSESIKGTVAYFYNDIDDLIERINDPVSGDKVYVNINKAEIQGVEVGLDVNFRNGLFAHANYTYMSTEDDSNDDRELEGRPRHRINLDLRYRFPFGLSASVQAAYTQRQYWEDGNYNWEKLPDYFLLNAKLTQDTGKLWGVDSELFIQGTNLTDKNYYELSGPEPGLNILAGFSLRYQ